jgi:hypothetical protein
MAATLSALCLSASPTALAQSSAPWLCRVHWEEQTYGGDTLATGAVFQIARSAPSMDSSAVYMGRGDANIVFTPGGGCRASRDRASVAMMVIVESEDGETAVVDIAPLGEDSFPVTVHCPAGHNSTMDVGASTPPSVELPLRDGATVSYDEHSRHSWGQVGGQRGTIRLEYCSRNGGATNGGGDNSLSPGSGASNDSDANTGAGPGQPGGPSDPNDPDAAAGEGVVRRPDNPNH